LVAGRLGSKDNSEGVKSFLEKRPSRIEGNMTDDALRVYPWWEPVDDSIGAKATNAKAKL